MNHAHTLPIVPNYRTLISNHLRSNNFAESLDLPRGQFTVDPTDVERAENQAHYDQDGFDAEYVAQAVMNDHGFTDWEDMAEELKNDVHDMFPNEKLWKHLDNLCDTLAEAYYNELMDNLLGQAETLLSA